MRTCALEGEGWYGDVSRLTGLVAPLGEMSCDSVIPLPSDHTLRTDASESEAGLT